MSSTIQCIGTRVPSETLQINSTLSKMGLKLGTFVVCSTSPTLSEMVTPKIMYYRRTVNTHLLSSALRFPTHNLFYLEKVFLW